MVQPVPGSVKSPLPQDTFQRPWRWAMLGTNPTWSTPMSRLSNILLPALLALALPTLALAADNDVSHVNGSITIAAGQPLGDASTVNGSIHVAAGAAVRDASTVNGSIELGARAQAHELSTVNGSVTLGAASRVSGEVGVVNGRLTLATGAEVLGKLGNVNGDITLTAAHVAGGIATVSGDITVGANSRVEGGIVVDKPSGWFHFNTTTPTVIIGPHAVVRGTLEFKREVTLKVSDSAQIGKVVGAKVQTFSGATP